MAEVLDSAFLLDDFYRCGENRDEFEALVRAIDRQTDHISRSGLTGFQLAYLEDGEGEGNFALGYLLEPGQPLQKKTDGRGETLLLPEKQVIRDASWPEGRGGAGLLEESLRKNRTMLLEKESGRLLFVSDLAFTTLAQRLGMTAGPLKEATLERNLFLARKMAGAQECTLVIRRGVTDGMELHKIFAFLGGEYRGMKLFGLCELYGELSEQFGQRLNLGPMECCFWEVSHERVSVCFEFPCYGQELCRREGWTHLMTPCLEFSTSDIGESSLHVRTCWRTKEGSVVPGRSYSRKHRGDSLKALDRMEEEILSMVQAEFTLFPKRLKELEAVRITPKDFNPGSKRQRQKNAACISRVFLHILRSTGVSKAIGKKREMALKDFLDSGVIQDEQVYTAYDVMMEVFRLPEDLNAYLSRQRGSVAPMSPETIRKFRKESIARAVYADFSQNDKEKQEERR